eukprot:TRINITY_DN773027_c0_g1_i1.p1 TRINITY_DN773027_c0_g1~~TRINITY_DN773027_c0_g1_i1.p1  ORF type:complete len:988 (+),score=213.65 TRINITY_DN773027_c0_g1_i1:127-3090(+)
MTKTSLSDGDDITLACSTVSCISCGIILVSFLFSKRLKSHPNVFLVWKAIFDGLFCFSLAAGSLKHSDGVHNWISDHCKLVGLVTQFSVIASEGIYLFQSVELRLSVSDPFHAYKKRSRQFIALSILIGLLSVGGLQYVDVKEHNVVGSNNPLKMCWIDRYHEHELNPHTWAFYYGPVMLANITAIFFFLISFYRLKKGLAETLTERRRAMINSTVFVGGIALYWSLVFTVYVVLFYQGDAGNPHKGMSIVLGCALSSRGIIMLIIWIFVGCNMPSTTQGPEINKALRKEILAYVPVGIKHSLLMLSKREKAGNLKDKTTLRLRKFNSLIHLKGFQRQGSNLAVEKKDARWENQTGWFIFIDHQPANFAAIRRTSRINDAEYVRTLMKSTKECFSEGASGAFLYFSEDQRYIVKTMSKEDMDSLLELAPAYSKYLCNNPHSIIAKFFSAHSIKMYRRWMHFVVMENVLLTPQTLHERYDLKGSWVNRSHKKPCKGEKAKCKYCSERYIVGCSKNHNCSQRPSLPHEPEVILKDNDLQQHLHLNPTKCRYIIQQAERDTEFLQSQGILDYSLLLGIHRERWHMEGGFMVRSRSNPSSTINVNTSSEGLDKVPYRQDSRRGRWTHNLPKSSTGPLHRRDEGGVDAMVVEGPSRYYFGIIDILQHWTFSKKMERFFKTVFRCQNKNGISAVKPEEYQERFMENIFMTYFGHNVHNPNLPTVAPAVNDVMNPIMTSNNNGSSNNLNQLSLLGTSNKNSFTTPTTINGNNTDETRSSYQQQSQQQLTSPKASIKNSNKKQKKKNNKNGKNKTPNNNNNNNKITNFVIPDNVSTGVNDDSFLLKKHHIVDEHQYSASYSSSMSTFSSMMNQVTPRKLVPKYETSSNLVAARPLTSHSIVSTVSQSPSSPPPPTMNMNMNITASNHHQQQELPLLIESTGEINYNDIKNPLLRNPLDIDSNEIDRTTSSNNNNNTGVAGGLDDIHLLDDSSSLV